MIAKARTIAVVGDIILVAFGIYPGALLYAPDLVTGLSETVEELSRQVEILERI